MKEEFISYGLPIWFMKTIGALKILLSMALIASIWIEQIEIYSCIGIIALMVGAISMHLKIGDPIKKSIPASIFLILTALIVWL
ncbi:MAG: DoxX family protein [Cytophagales bacterium]|nr:DoxX family protein [Cytophagales bacterium]